MSKSESHNLTGNGEYQISGGKKMILQILNVIGFIFAMFFNALSSTGVISSNTLSGITTTWNAKIAPAGYAFSIWALIYTLLAIFVLYQALPPKLVPSRNNQLVFGDINYMFAANMLLNGIWLPIFQLNSKLGFVLGLLIIIVMLTTALYMMMKATREKVNAWEFISMRLGLSIYSGWLTAATILNVTYMLKSFGVKDPTLGSFNEQYWTVLILYVAFLIYNVATYMEKNPAYGAVFIWVLFAILNNTNRIHPELEVLKTNCKIIIALHITSIVGIFGYLLYVKYRKDPEDQLNRGLLY